MPSRPILVRVVLLAVLLAGLVALADGITRRQLNQAVMASQNDGGRVVARVAGVAD
ncbi:hypothetical protein ACRAWG_35370 [Methylobacterium sp. P31]